MKQNELIHNESPSECRETSNTVRGYACWGLRLKLKVNMERLEAPWFVGGAARDYRRAKTFMPSRRKAMPAAKAKEREARKPHKPQARKSADRRFRRASSSAPGLLPEMEWQTRQRGRRAVHPPVSQGQPITPLVIWKVYKHPEDYPGEYVARKFVITEDFYGPNGSISSRSLRDVRNVLRSLYRGLTQLKRPPNDEPHIVEVWL